MQDATMHGYNSNQQPAAFHHGAATRKGDAQTARRTIGDTTTTTPMLECKPTTKEQTRRLQTRGSIPAATSLPTTPVTPTLGLRARRGVRHDLRQQEQTRRLPHGDSIPAAINYDAELGYPTRAQHGGSREDLQQNNIEKTKLGGSHLALTASGPKGPSIL